MIIFKNAIFSYSSGNKEKSLSKKCDFLKIFENFACKKILKSKITIYTRDIFGNLVKNRHFLQISVFRF